MLYKKNSFIGGKDRQSQSQIKHMSEAMEEMQDKIDDLTELNQDLRENLRINKESLAALLKNNQEINDKLKKIDQQDEDMGLHLINEISNDDIFIQSENISSKQRNGV